jgi:hypothetical protein
MVIFHSYVSLPEGTVSSTGVVEPSHQKQHPIWTLRLGIAAIFKGCEVPDGDQAEFHSWMGEDQNRKERQVIY